MSNNIRIFKQIIELLVSHIGQLITIICFKEYLKMCIRLNEEHYIKSYQFLKSIFQGKWKRMLNYSNGNFLWMVLNLAFIIFCCVSTHYGYLKHYFHQIPQKQLREDYTMFSLCTCYH